MTANVKNYIDQIGNDDNVYHFEGTVYFGDDVYSGTELGNILQANKSVVVNSVSPAPLNPNNVTLLDSTGGVLANTLTVPSSYSRILILLSVGTNAVTVTGSEGAQFVDSTGTYTIMTFNAVDDAIELVKNGASATDWRVVRNTSVVLS